MQKVILKPYYLDPVLFNIFINDLFFSINKAKIANFADYNTDYTNSAEMETLKTF